MEDDLLNALFVEETLQYAGHEVVGPAKTIDQALTLLEKREVDAALLDLQIHDEVSLGVGLKLDELCIPWAITTAHSPNFVSPLFSHIRLLVKPFGVAALLQVVRELLDRSRSANPNPT